MSLGQDEAVDLLLVEDNPQDAELTLRAIRKRDRDARLGVVEDGAEALDYLFCREAHSGRDPSHRPKAIFLDLKLPKLGGLEVLQAIKSDERTRSIPVVMLTSSREEADLAAAYGLGANSYLVKPIDYAEYQECIGTSGHYWLSINKTPAAPR